MKNTILSLVMAGVMALALTLPAPAETMGGGKNGSAVSAEPEEGREPEKRGEPAEPEERREHAEQGDPAEQREPAEQGDSAEQREPAEQGDPAEQKDSAEQGESAGNGQGKTPQEILLIRDMAEAKEITSLLEEILESEEIRSLMAYPEVRELGILLLERAADLAIEDPVLAGQILTALGMDEQGVETFLLLSEILRPYGEDIKASVFRYLLEEAV